MNHSQDIKVGSSYHFRWTVGSVFCNHEGPSNLILYAVYAVFFTSSNFATSAPAPIVSSTSSTADLNSPTVPIGVSKAKFASVDGRLFKIDGRTQYFAGKDILRLFFEVLPLSLLIGTNTWWLGYLTNNTDVDLVLQQITRVGVARDHTQSSS